MTENERKVIQRAFDVTDSIVSGISNIPTPMIYAINRLQDAVWEVLRERGETLSKLISDDYKKIHDEYWNRHLGGC